MNITTVGVDLAKTLSQVHGVDERGKVAVRKQLKRTEFIKGGGSNGAVQPDPRTTGRVWFVFPRGISYPERRLPQIWKMATADSSVPVESYLLGYATIFANLIVAFRSWIGK